MIKKINSNNNSDINNENNIRNNMSPIKNFWKKERRMLLSPQHRTRFSVEHPRYVPRLREILNNQFWLQEYRIYMRYFDRRRRMKYLYFIFIMQEFFKFRLNNDIDIGINIKTIGLPNIFTLLFPSNSKKNKKKKKNGININDNTNGNNNNSINNNNNNECDLLNLNSLNINTPLTINEINSKLTFDLTDFDPNTQKQLNLKEYSQFIYYNFVHKISKYHIQFSDDSIVKYIEKCLFDNETIHKNERERQFNDDIKPDLYDKMWNAVFRYLHQMTYEKFVIWINKN